MLDSMLVTMPADSSGSSMLVEAEDGSDDSAEEVEARSRGKDVFVCVTVRENLGEAAV